MPFDQDAARQTFIEIADEIHDVSEVDQLLEITDNIPLAVQLVAGVAASVGCQDTMERWNVERTALLSAGYNKRSNLDTSITLSLSSPRMLSSPHAAELLSLMSLLSDGISDLDLAQSNIPIQDIPIARQHLSALHLPMLTMLDNLECWHQFVSISKQHGRPPCNWCNPCASISLIFSNSIRHGGMIPHSQSTCFPVLS
jgi:hypothetical protein